MNDIELIKESVDIVQYIGRYVELKRAGQNYVGLCPFHKEKTPSFVVSPEKKIFKCFGCGVSGDIFKFVMLKENLEFRDALEKLAEVTGIRLSKHENKEVSAMYKVYEMATAFFMQEFQKSKFAQNYAYHKRVFGSEVSKSFKLGYCRPGSHLFNFLSKNGFSEDLVDRAGLIVHSRRGIMDRFGGRLIFPIMNSAGKVVGFTGRKIRDEDFGPKYLHSPENPLFRKRYLLYGLSHSSAYINEADLCIICEGTTDVIMAHQYGIKNIVAPLGTSITIDQIKLALKRSKNLLFFFDSDEAGQNAILRVFNMVLNEDGNFFVATPKPFKDLDELLKSDAKLAKKKIRDRVDLFKYVLSLHLAKDDLTVQSGFNDFIRFVRKTANFVKDPAKQDFFLTSAASLSGIEKNLFLQKRNMGSFSRTGVIPSKTQIKARVRNKPVEDLELYLLAYLSEFGSKNRLPMEITPLAFRTARQVVRRFLDEDKLTLSEPLLSEVEMLRSTINFEDAEKQFKVLYNRLRDDTYRFWVQQIKQKIAIAEGLGDEEQVNKLMQKLSKLTSVLKIHHERNSG